jgi:hypothetical protein
MLSLQRKITFDYQHSPAEMIENTYDRSSRADRYPLSSSMHHTKE